MWSVVVVLVLHYSVHYSLPARRARNDNKQIKQRPPLAAWHQQLLGLFFWDKGARLARLAWPVVVVHADDKRRARVGPSRVLFFSCRHLHFASGTDHALMLEDSLRLADA